MKSTNRYSSALIGDTPFDSGRRRARPCALNAKGHATSHVKCRPDKRYPSPSGERPVRQQGRHSLAQFILLSERQGSDSRTNRPEQAHPPCTGQR